MTRGSETEKWPDENAEFGFRSGEGAIAAELCVAELPSSRHGLASDMNFPHFVRIEQESSDGSTHYFVVHTHDPKMAIKFGAETINGQVKPGTIQHLSVPNSWAGQYSQYAKLLAKAEAFFRASLMTEEERVVANRLQR